MKIIDAHNHPDWHGHNFDRFLRNMDQYNIDQTWLLSWECQDHEYSNNYLDKIPAGVLGSANGPIPFERCLRYIERAPERFILGYCPDPRHPAACDKLRAAHEIYGARICGEFKFRMMYDNPDAIMLCRQAGELKMPVVLHFDYNYRLNCHEAWSEWWGGTIQTLERLLQACPETIFMGHAPGFWIHISGDKLYKQGVYPPDNAPVLPGGEIPRLLRCYPNLYCDISAGSGWRALSRDLSFSQNFLSEFQDRICYARDYFDNIHQELLNSLDLPESVLNKIYSGNAEKILKDYPLPFKSC